MKRRVASLPPISVAVFNEKVLERRTETAVMSSAQGSSCEVCKLVSRSFFLIIRNPHVYYSAKRILQRTLIALIYNQRNIRKTSLNLL